MAKTSGQERKLVRPTDVQSWQPSMECEVQTPYVNRGRVAAREGERRQQGGAPYRADALVLSGAAAPRQPPQGSTQAGASRQLTSMLFLVPKVVGTRGAPAAH